MPSLELTMIKADPLYEGYASPAVKFSAQAVNKASDHIHFCYLSCNVYLKAAKQLMLGSTPIVMTGLGPNQPRDVEFTFSFDIDANNAIHDVVKQPELEDVPFRLHFIGSLLFGPPGQPSASSTDASFEREIGLPVDKYRRLLSTYYRDLSWISVSRDTYSQLKDLMNKSGLASMDELIQQLIGSSK